MGARKYSAAIHALCTRYGGMYDRGHGNHGLAQDYSNSSALATAKKTMSTFESKIMVTSVR